MQSLFQFSGARRFVKATVLTAFLGGLLTTAQAQIVSYTSATSGALNSVATNASGTALARVNGATSPGSPCSTGFSSAGFSTTTTYSSSLAAIEVTCTPATGYSLNVTGFSVDLRRSASGPASVRYAYSTDGGTTWTNQGTNQAPDNASCGTTTTGTWTTSFTVAAPATLKFRVYGFNASSTAGTFQILNLLINGTVTGSGGGGGTANPKITYYLKSRLILPQEKAPDGEPSADEMAARLRWRLQRLDAMRAAASRLMNRERLDRDVFGRGDPEPVNVIKLRTYKDTLYDLLTAYATDRARKLGGKAYKPVMAPVLQIEEARERLERMLGKISDWSGLTRLLPLEWQGGSRRRSAMASTLLACLELARDGKVEISQGAPFEEIYVRDRAGPLAPLAPQAGA